MPWRGHPDPYAVWVSEIMLQQTRVETATPYFERFTDRFPSVATLAAADLQDVLRLWQGLGYYTRARNLHKAAQLVCERHGGKLPDTAAVLRSLPGIGAYTAAAIASICFGEREPVIDGNVLRVVARVLRVDDDVRGRVARQRIEQWLRPLIAGAPVPGDFNQAMMELGALVCMPKAPSCSACPFAEHCLAHTTGDPADYPVKAPARGIPTRAAVGVVLWRNGRILLARRVGERFLGDLWELPGGFCESGESPAATLARTLPAQTGLTPEAPAARGIVRHVYSHFRLELHVFEARGSVGTLPRGASDRLRWVRPSELGHLPLSNAPRAAIALVLDAGAPATS
jgi:A/G-specific adenine glycosylase